MRDFYLKSDVGHMEAMLIKDEHLSTDELMHRASYGCYEAIMSLGLIGSKSSVIICAGSGHNGGDALLLATHLDPHVSSLKIYLTSNKKPHEASIKKAKAILGNDKIVNLESTQASLDAFKEDLKSADMLIDGIYGTGFRDPLNPYLESLFQIINQHKINVISIDIPSGLESDSGRVKTAAIKATHTLAIGAFKPCHFLFDGLDYCGHLHLIDIGLKKPNLDVKRFVIDQTYFSKMTFKRRHNTHKYHHGNLLVIGGSIGLMGAPVLSALAAYRSGCGLVSILYTEKTYPHRFHIMPEIMTHTLNDETSLRQITSKKSAVAFGMGLDQLPIYKEILKTLLDQNMPLVIDAGGLFHFKTLLQTLKKHPIIITPHAKELADLLSISTDQVLANPIELIESFAKTCGVTVCLKGPTTLVTDGYKTAICPFGNAGLAKAGSGDVLSGIIGALLSQGKSPYDAALLGVYILGTSADNALKIHGEVSMMATDVIDHIKDVFIEINT
ncbi:MAG: NAD(P)H-hydrate dehydratase [Acholeplasmataceae bacterium]